MSSPPDASDDGSNVASSNHTLLYIIVAVLIGVMLYVVVRYGRSVLAEYRQLQAGHGARRGARFGLSAEEIAALPTFTYRVRAASASPHPPHGDDRDRRRRRSGSKGRGATAVECVVCLQELEDGDVVRVLPSCRHFFHGGCIDVWLQEHTTCPVCRADLEPECDRLAEAAAVTSPPLPQLRRCGVSPERPSPSRVLADILSRSPLRSPSPGPMAYARVDDQWAKTPSPARLSEIRVVRSKTSSPIRFSKQHLSPSPRGIGVLESGEVITSASSAPVVPEIVIARSMTPSPTRLNRQLSARSNDVVIPLTPPSPSPMTIGEGGGGSLSKSSSPVHN